MLNATIIPRTTLPSSVLVIIRLQLDSRGPVECIQSYGTQAKIRGNSDPNQSCYSYAVALNSWPTTSTWLLIHQGSKVAKGLIRYWRCLFWLLNIDIENGLTGNREPKESGEKEFPKQKDVKEGSNLDLAQKARRFMIYVHSKLLIADDEVGFDQKGPCSSYLLRSDRVRDKIIFLWAGHTQLRDF